MNRAVRPQVVRVKLTPDILKVSIELTRPFPFRDEDVEEQLLAQGFARPEDTTIVIRLAPDGSQSQAIHWTRDGVDAFYEATRGRLAIEGREFQEVGEAFSKLLVTLDLLLKKSKDVSVNWAELVVKLRAYGTPAPLEAFRAVGLSDAAKSLSEALKEELNPFSITLYSAAQTELSRPLTKVEDWVHLTIAPLVPNPSVYAIQLVYRKSDPDAVRQQLRELAETLERALTSLGIEGE